MILLAGAFRDPDGRLQREYEQVRSYILFISPAHAFNAETAFNDVRLYQRTPGAPARDEKCDPVGRSRIGE